MTRRALATVFLLAILCGCLGGAATTDAPAKGNGTAQKGLQKANPASEYCLEQGGKVKIVEEETGGQRGICEIDGVECDEWKYMRGECPGTEDGTTG